MNVAAELLLLETALLSAEVRRDAARVGALLAEEFREFGASGRAYTRAEILAALAAEAPAVITLHDFVCARLSAGVALVTYRSRREGVEALRSSVWERRDGRWQMVFHQGTRVRAETPA